MICFPCDASVSQFLPLCTDRYLDPLLMNAFNNVNLAASCVLTYVEYARELGIPESKWIYPLGGAGTQDADNCKSIRVRKSRRLADLFFVQSGSVQISSRALRFHVHWMLACKSLIYVKTRLICLISTRMPFGNLVPKLYVDSQSRCFPIVPKLACQHLDIPLIKSLKPITVLGGLTSFGGAGNNYSMHVRSL